MNILLKFKFIEEKLNTFWIFDELIVFDYLKISS